MPRLSPLLSKLISSSLPFLLHPNDRTHVPTRLKAEIVATRLFWGDFVERGPMIYPLDAELSNLQVKDMMAPPRRS
jgi:hypothetical protein